jgi:23S rRNA U2552 (ribose-2'-O)-methylase RlmE/FtsJ
MSLSTLNLNELPEDYIPIVYKIQDMPNIFKQDSKISFTPDLDYPKFSYGLTHFYHQSKDKMEPIEKQFEKKKKVYQVLSKFEQYVDDYDLSIGNISDTYFNITKSTPAILSRAIFKLWELLLMFDLIDVNQDNYVTAHLAEGPGSFTQAVMFYRSLYSKLNKKDKYYCITLHSESTQVPKITTDFLNYYKANLILQETYPEKIASKSQDKTNGDLTQLKTIKIFNSNFKLNKAQLVTADGGFPWKNENLQEQEAFKLIFGEIVAAITVQKDGGHFVCKIYETFTENTLKLISILKAFYSEVYVTKPLTSRASNSEKYLVCKNFKANKENLTILELMFKDIEKNSSLDVLSIFSSYVISREFRLTMINLNILVSNIQFVAINKLVDFVNKQNYRGTVYLDAIKQQIDASKFWVNTFYCDLDKYKEHKTKLLKFTQSIISLSELSIKSLDKQIE